MHTVMKVIFDERMMKVIFPQPSVELMPLEALNVKHVFIT